MATNIWFWILFNVFVIGMLALDLGVFHRHSHRVTVREAGIWISIWVFLALVFCAGLYYFEGQTVALEFLGGYLLEESLSVDNIFVFVLVFAYFKVAPQYQHRVLFWGILTALLLRGTMILVGTALVSRFEFLIAVFGVILIITAIRMARDGEVDIDISKNPLVRLARRFIPLSDTYYADKFFIVEAGKRMATPLLIVLLVVESSDVVFAIDSIPAVFGITKNPFIVYTSNIFAILGLRSLYFLLAGIVGKFHYLKLGLSVVLGFVGLKMIAESVTSYTMEHPIHVPIHWSLLFIALVLTVSIGASLLFPPSDHEAEAELGPVAPGTGATERVE